MKKTNIKNKFISEDLIPYKYGQSNLEFRKLLSNPPDLKTSEPMELYYWVKKLVDLTKV